MTQRLLMHRPRHGQRGMALLIALVVLVVVSILGVVAMRTALFQSRVSVNSQIQNLAFQAAESGLDSALQRAKEQIADGIMPRNEAHIFNQAVNVRPQRVCLTEDGVQVIPDGIYNAADAPDYSDGTECEALPESNTTVTTVLGLAPDSHTLAIQNMDPMNGAVAQGMQMRAYAEVPNTHVTAVHAEEWGMYRPSDEQLYNSDNEF